jgi:hypothetical protein
MQVNSDDGRCRPWVSQSYYQHYDRVGISERDVDLEAQGMEVDSECCFISKPAKAPIFTITPDFIVQLQQGKVAGLHVMCDSTYRSSAT